MFAMPVLPILLALLLWTLPPAELPRPAYPSSQLYAALPYHPLDPNLTVCQGKHLDTGFWVECQEEGRAFAVTICSATYLGDDPLAPVADWRVTCHQYGGNASPPAHCHVTVYLTTGQQRYDCRQYGAPGIPARRWGGWV